MVGLAEASIKLGGNPLGGGSERGPAHISPGKTQRVAVGLIRRSFQALGRPGQRHLPESSNDAYREEGQPPRALPTPECRRSRSETWGSRWWQSRLPPHLPTDRVGTLADETTQSIEPYATPLLFWGCGCGPRGQYRPTKPAEARHVNRCRWCHMPCSTTDLEHCAGKVECAGSVATLTSGPALGRSVAQMPRFQPSWVPFAL